MADTDRMMPAEFVSVFARRFQLQVTERMIPPKCGDCGLCTYTMSMSTPVSCMNTFGVNQKEAPPTCCPIREQVRDLTKSAEAILDEMLRKDQ